MAESKTIKTTTKKPFYRGNPTPSVLEIRRSLKLTIYQLISAILFLIIGQALVSDSFIFKAISNGIIIAIFLMFVYSEGAKSGEDDVTYSEIIYSKLKNGEVANKFQIGKCYNPIKGFLYALIGYFPFILLAITLSFATSRQYFEIGALPSWLMPFQKNEQLAIATEFYREASALSFVDIVRIIVRMVLFPFINLFNINRVESTYVFEKLSPLIMLVFPTAFGLGYLRGPKLRELVHKGIAKGVLKKSIKKNPTRTTNSNSKDLV